MTFAIDRVRDLFVRDAVGGVGVGGAGEEEEGGGGGGGGGEAKTCEDEQLVVEPVYTAQCASIRALTNTYCWLCCDTVCWLWNQCIFTAQCASI